MNRWYKNLKKSNLTPPSWIFGTVWPILYFMTFISLSLVWNNKKCFPYCSSITYFFIQLFFNLIWTTLFFYYRLPLYALFDIILVIIFTVITFKKFIKYNKFSAYLLIPYLLWLSFASYLNLFIVLNN